MVIIQVSACRSVCALSGSRRHPYLNLSLSQRSRSLNLNLSQRLSLKKRLQTLGAIIRLQKRKVRLKKEALKLVEMEKQLKRQKVMAVKRQKEMALQ